MQILRLISFAVILLAVCAVKTPAQETIQRTPPGDREDSPGPLPDYVLEVRRPDGCLVSPISPKNQSGLLLYALPRPARVPRDSSGQPITSKVVVWAKQNDGLWEVKVSIGKGEFFDAGDITVGEFKLNLNQRAEVPDFSRFGLAPIRVGVVKIERQQAGKPSFRNHTESVSLESMEAANLPEPFKLVIKNNSSSDLIAIQYNTLRHHEFLELKWLSDGLLNPLIKTGESYTLKAVSEDKSCGDEDGYRPGQSNRIELVSAVFADGSYEGQAGLAALVKGAALGNRKNLERVVETIRETSDPLDLSLQLKALHEGTNEEADPYLVETLRGMFPTIAADTTTDSTAVLTGFIRSGMHDIRMNLLRDAQQLRRVSEANGVELGKLVVIQTKRKYERWWAAAQKITSH